MIFYEYLTKDNFAAFFLMFCFAQNLLTSMVWCSFFFIYPECILLFRPSSKSSLVTIDGISESLCQRFGHAFIKEVEEFCRENKLSVDNMSTKTENNSTLVSFVYFG